MSPANRNAAGPLWLAWRLLCCAGILAACPAAPRAAPVLQGIADLQRAARLTGDTGINQTGTRWNVAGTDLGHVFEHGDRLYMVFGDTFGEGFVAPPGAGPAPDWRSNVMAVIADRDPTDGLTFESMITDAYGDAKELIAAQRDQGEVTVIPTNGVSALGFMFLHYMAVSQWGSAGSWTLRHSGLAYSPDNGQRWQRLSWTFPGDSNFGQVAFARHDGFIYLLGIPGGRFGGMQVARVPESSPATRSTYRFYAGLADGEPVWSADVAQAVTVVEAPVGELSVMWNAFLGRWILTYLRGPDLVIREAPDLTGPWGDPITLVSHTSYPGLYGAYMHPWLVERNGEIVYFTMSEWFTYGVSLMKVRLVKRPDPLTMEDVARALRVSGGLETATAEDAARLMQGTDRIDLPQAVRLMRTVTGLD